MWVKGFFNIRSHHIQSYKRRIVAIAVDAYSNFQSHFSQNCIFQIG